MGRSRDLQIFDRARGLFPVSKFSGIGVGIDDALIGGTGLLGLLFDGEILAQRDPVLGRCFPGCFHEREFALSMGCSAQLRLFLHRFCHVIGHGFDSMVFVYGGLHLIGFEIGIERLHMIFDDGCPLLVYIMMRAA